MNQIELIEVCKKFKNYYAVRNVSMSIKKGEIVGLVGESGCGKTTITKILTRLMQQDSGRILFQGVDISKAKKKALDYFRSRVQIVFQNPTTSFDPRITIGASILEAIKTRKDYKQIDIKKYIDRLIRSVELPVEIAHRFPHEVSGGECQRAAIARALSIEPEVLVCDEAVSSLDVLAQARILNLFLKLQKERGLSILFVSHNIRVVRHICDRMYVMNEGEICEYGNTSQVLENPAHPYTRQLVSASRIF